MPSSIVARWGREREDAKCMPPASHRPALGEVGRASVLWCGKPNRVLRAEERERREHAAVVLGGRRQAQLPEDARDVLLDRAWGDDEALGDRLVRPSLRDELEHLALARRERRERIVRTAAADETRDDGG